MSLPLMLCKITSTFLPSFPTTTHSNILCSKLLSTKYSWDSELAHKSKPFKGLECHFLCVVHLSYRFAIICLFYPHCIMNFLNISIFSAYFQGWYTVSSKIVALKQGQFCFPGNTCQHLDTLLPTGGKLLTSSG